MKQKSVLVLLALFCISSSLLAYDFKSGKLYYNILKNATVEVTYQDLTNPYTFSTITIPETVTYNGTTYIVVRIGNDAFENCTSLRTVSMSDEVTTIDVAAFSGCTNLTTITLSNNIGRIFYAAFRGCSNLSKITLPSSLWFLDQAVFQWCHSLTEIIIPENVETIGDDVFEGCYALNKISVSSQNTTYDSRNNCNAIIETETNTLLYGCNGTTIPNGIVAISDNAFKWSYIRSITIPGTVKRIGENAFSACCKLTSVQMLEGVNNIEEDAFAGCEKLTSITFPSSLTKISANVFGSEEIFDFKEFHRFDSVPWFKTATKKCTQPCYINNILYEYYGSENAKIKDGTIHINEYAFNNVDILSVVIPNSVKSIGKGAFWFQNELTSIEIPESVEYLGAYALGECWALEKATIKGHIDTLHNGTFFQCFSLKECLLPNSIEYIGDSIFANCEALENITIPGGTQYVGDIAFYGSAGFYIENSSLKNVNCYSIIPPVLGENVFYREDKDENKINTIPLYVPIGSEEAYQSAEQWKEFKSITALPKTEARLNGITYNDIAIENFDKNTYSYSVVLPWYVDEVPVVSAILIDPLSTMQIIPATQLPGDTKIVVTAQEDGKTQRTYTIHFDIQTGIESTQPAAILPTKTLRNGQVMIRKNGKTYDVLGKQIE